MNHIEAMKQALDALEYYRSGEDYQPTPASEAMPVLRQAIQEAALQQLTDIHQEIEQVENDTRYSDIQLAEMILSDCGVSSENTSLLNRVAARITQQVDKALAEQWTPDDIAYRPGGLSMEQKPVAWWNPDESGLSFKQLRGDWQPLYAAPVHAIDTSEKRVDETAKDKHEPDVYGDGNVYRGQRSKDSTTRTLHYTTPPRSSWFKLTDDEVWDEWVRAVDESNSSNRELAFRFARAIESRLKEKNT